MSHQLHTVVLSVAWQRHALRYKLGFLALSHFHTPSSSRASHPFETILPEGTFLHRSGTSGNSPAARTSEPTQCTTSHSQATISQQEPPSFALVAAMGSSHNLNMSNLPPVLEMPSTPAHQSLQPLVAVLPQTPARQAMNCLITQMSAQAVITSPGPWLHTPGAGSDGESEPDGDPETSDSDPETFPVHRLCAWRPHPMTQGDADDEEIVISLNSDDENTSPVHTSPQRNSALRQPRQDSNTAEPVPSRRQDHSNKWLGFSVNTDNFA
ncbi:hypothetical protein C8R44DRAFT_753519 [Mycena epipterygia]|nr:hypothetical protein C8R44DRAFT_753519 [Mycena epipterygia]